MGEMFVLVAEEKKRTLTSFGQISLPYRMAEKITQR